MKVSSEILDPVIVAKWFKNDLRIIEVDEAPPGGDEELLFFDIDGATAEFMAGSWRLEETGDYEIEVTNYNEPDKAEPGDDFLDIIDNNDRSIFSNDFEFRFNYYELTGIDASKGATIFIERVEATFPSSLFLIRLTTNQSIKK